MTHREKEKLELAIKALALIKLALEILLTVISLA